MTVRHRPSTELIPGRCRRKMKRHVTVALLPKDHLALRAWSITTLIFHSVKGLLFICIFANAELPRYYGNFITVLSVNCAGRGFRVKIDKDLEFIDSVSML